MFHPSKVELDVAAAVRLTMSTLLVHLCSGLLLAPRVAVRFDAVDPSILSLLRAGGLYTTLDDFSAAAEGLAVWRSALAAGRVPDFEGVDAAAGAPWPVQPLRGALGDAMLELGMPSTTQRHPSLIPAALTAVLAAARRFDAASGEHKADAPAAEGAHGASQPRDDDVWEEEEEEEEEEEAAAVAEAAEDGDGEETAAAESAQRLAEELRREWSPALSGVRAVEGLQSGGAAGGDVGALTAQAGGTFSPHDGLWRHAGWAPLQRVQSQLRELDELSALLASLGERPAAEGAPRRGPAARADPRAAPSAARSALSPRELSGLGRSGELARAAPSELALLAADSRTRRRLFLSRLLARLEPNCTARRGLSRAIAAATPCIGGWNSPMPCAQAAAPCHVPGWWSGGCSATSSRAGRRRRRARCRAARCGCRAREAARWSCASTRLTRWRAGASCSPRQWCSRR